MTASPPEIKKVVVHPLVLLSVVDHFNRIRNQRRVVGILLGHWQKNGDVDVSNSFARKIDFICSFRLLVAVYVRLPVLSFHLYQI